MVIVANLYVKKCKITTFLRTSARIGWIFTYLDPKISQKIHDDDYIAELLEVLITKSVNTL
jgi:hypothetical protein